MDNTEKRKFLYSNGAMINFPINSEEYLTVDEAVQLYYSYILEGQTEKCEYLKEEIKKAKQIIREDYS